MRRTLISVFVFWNIFAVLVGKNFEGTWASRLVMPYLVWTRLLQQWNLFVPDPRKEAIRYRAEVEMEDGQVIQWQRPYPPNWDFFERHLVYHFQKWDLATQQLDQYPGLWLDLAEFLERGYRRTGYQPRVIRWLRSTAKRPPPPASGPVFLGSPLERDSRLEWVDRVVFIYDYRTRRFVP